MHACRGNSVLQISTARLGSGGDRVCTKELSQGKEGTGVVLRTCHMRRCLCQLTPRKWELRWPTRETPRETASEVGLPARSALAARLSVRAAPCGAPGGSGAGLLAGCCSSSPYDMLPLITRSEHMQPAA